MASPGSPQKSTATKLLYLSITLLVHAFYFQHLWGPVHKWCHLFLTNSLDPLFSDFIITLCSVCHLLVYPYFPIKRWRHLWTAPYQYHNSNFCNLFAPLISSSYHNSNSFLQNSYQQSLITISLATPISFHLPMFFLSTGLMQPFPQHTDFFGCMVFFLPLMACFLTDIQSWHIFQCAC